MAGQTGPETHFAVGKKMRWSSIEAAGSPKLRWGVEPHTSEDTVTLEKPEPWCPGINGLCLVALRLELCRVT